MLVVLPDAVDGLSALEASLTSERLDAIVTSLSPTRVVVSLPKFEIDPTGSLPLGDVLQALGMKAAFSRDRADFTAMANPPDPADRLFISQVFHKAFVRVDEKGTEAAAATAVVMARAAAAMAANGSRRTDQRCCCPPVSDPRACCRATAGVSAPSWRRSVGIRTRS